MSQESNDEIKESIIQYFIFRHKDTLMNILESPDTTISHAILVDLLDLISEVPELTSKFFVDSSFYLNLFQSCMLEAQKQLIKSDSELLMTLKSKIAVRLHTLPGAEDVEIQLPQCKHINKFVTFNGTVTKAFEKRCTETIQRYCCAKCGVEIVVQIDFGHTDLFVRPVKCFKEDCKSDRFNPVVDAKESFKTTFKDYQELKIQEKLDILSVGTVPKSVIVIVEDDLVDTCKPGDDITINGLVINKWSRSEPNMRCDVELIIHANYIKINNEQQSRISLTNEKKKEFDVYWKETFKNEPIKGRNLILKSICPKLYGMYVIRLAVSLVLTGGVSRKDQSTGTRIRGESHLLLVGDPGTGKSQILKYASKILPRGINTTGMGSTSAGLTATASRDGGMWHLEPGALVLADGGICCIDEFNCMKNDDKNSMLEAMEQQTISVAKAGIVCNLKTQCSVLAACNPKGKYDSNQPMTVNLGIPSPLLSRFDVVLLLLDTPNETWDNAASKFLLEGVDMLKNLKIDEDASEEDGNSDEKEEMELWPFQDLRLYINYVKSLRPKLTQNANTVIQEYYMQQRNMPASNKARTTARMLESIIRLSQAHAKLMFREQVLVMDAVVAITLMESSLDQGSLFATVNILHTSFPTKPENEYKEQAFKVLSSLKLADVWKEEEIFIDNKFTCIIDEIINKMPTQQPSSQYKTQNEKTSFQTQKPASQHIQKTQENKSSPQFIEPVPPPVVPPTPKLSQTISSSHKRKFLEDEVLVSSSLDNNSYKKIKSLNTLNSSQQPILIDQANTQSLASSTQKTQSQMQSQTQSKNRDNMDDLDINDLEIDI